MESDSDRKRDVPEDAEELATAAVNSRWQRLKKFLHAVSQPFLRVKRLLSAGLLRIIDASSGLLQRLRKRAETPNEEEPGEDRHRDDSSETPVARKKTAPPPNSKGATPPTAEAIKSVEPRSPVRSFFIYLLVLIIGGIAGMTFSFTLLSKMTTNQAQKIGDQRDEITQMEHQLSRILQSEAKYRLESMEYQKRLSEVENHLNSAIPKPGGNTPPTESAGNRSVPATGKSPVSLKSGECTLESGKIGDNLSRCINQFNSK